MDFDQSSFAVQQSALENDAVSTSPQVPSETPQSTPLAQLDSDILQGLIEEKQTIDKMPSSQQDNETILGDSNFLNGNTAFGASNLHDTNLGLSTTMASENILNDENVCPTQFTGQRHVRENFNENNQEILGNTEPNIAEKNNFENRNWEQNYPEQSTVQESVTSTEQPNCDMAQMANQSQTSYHSVVTDEKKLTPTANYHGGTASSCMQQQQQGFQQENCSNPIDAQANFAAMHDQQFGVPFNDQTKMQDQVPAYKSPCTAEITQSQASNPLPVQQHIDTSQTMLSPDESYHSVSFSAPNMASTLSYNANPGDTCLVSGGKLNPGANNHYQGHGYHGNGDIGSSSGYETQSNTSASPYTSPDSIASLQQGGSDVTTCTSASSSQMDMQFSSHVQTSICSGGQRVPGFSQPPHSSSSLMYSAPSKQHCP